ncbi:MAG: TonB-dependent receptor, partial [Ignavibacteriaceae bacterium]|nr:TonB-dependent receptor [Ignavibacteriaceae bacterium]
MKYYVFVFVLLFTFFVSAQETSSTGAIKGKVIVSEGLYPLIGVNIAVKDKSRGTTSDTDGNFEIAKLPIGSYMLVYSYIGYETFTQTDIIVRPARITFVEAKMIESSLKMDDVVVSAGYFNKIEAQPVSIVNFSAEEIRRSPGAAGDVSRILFGLPSLAKTNDQKNSLIVRGGSPMENTFFVDNIEIPNINHYGTQGSSEGPIGVINIDFLKDVNFHSGGFGVNYGDRLSSVMEMTFREGNREQFDFQLDASFQALGGQVEGPINNGKGSYLFSARRSYLDWIFSSTQINGPVPTYSDYHTKVVYDLSDNLKLSILDITSIDKSNQSYEEGVKFEDNYFGGYNGGKNTFGVNLQNIWGRSGYSDISLSHNYFDMHNTVNEVRTHDKVYSNKSIEQEFAIRNLNHFKVSDNIQIQFGFDLKYATNKYDHHYYPFVDMQGYTSPELVVNNKFNGSKAGLFASV